MRFEARLRVRFRRRARLSRTFWQVNRPPVSRRGARSGQMTEVCAERTRWLSFHTDRPISIMLRVTLRPVPNLATCSAHEKIPAIFIVFLPLHVFDLHSVAFAPVLRRVFSLGDDALEPALAAFSRFLNGSEWRE
jgi:hypothetical protein